MTSSRQSVHFGRAAIAVPPRILVRTEHEVKKLLTMKFLADHDFSCGMHDAVVNPAHFRLKGKTLPCAIVAQKGLDKKLVRNIYLAPVASEIAFGIVSRMNSLDTRSALAGFKNAYEMNLHYSFPASWGKAGHPWQRNSAI